MVQEERLKVLTLGIPQLMAQAGHPTEKLTVNNSSQPQCKTSSQLFTSLVISLSLFPPQISWVLCVFLPQAGTPSEL